MMPSTPMIIRFRRVDLKDVPCSPRADDGADAVLARAGPSLDASATLSVISASAAGRRFLSYGGVAAASGLPWSAARRRMDPHLFALCRWATERGWPLLSAIVVDQKSVAHGAMRGRPLIGFARCAERCGRVVGVDAAAFLSEEQRRVFEWFAPVIGADPEAASSRARP